MTIPPALQRFIMLLRASVRSVPWLRAGAIAVGLAMVAGIVIIVSGERRFRVRATVHVRTKTNAETAAATHLGALLSPRTIIAAEEAAAEVRELVESRLRVHTELEHKAVTLELTAVTLRPERDRQRLDALGKAYVRRHNATTQPTPANPSIRTHLHGHRNGLHSKQAAVGAEIERLTPMSAGKTVEERKRLAALLTDRRRQWQQATGQHVAAVAVLDKLQAAPTPKGTVDPADRAQVETQDASLQQDEKALLDKLAQVHDELAKTIAAVKPAVITSTDALEKLETALSHQREAQADLEVAALLERMSVTVTDHRAAVEGFAQAWDKGASGLPKPNDVAQADALLARQAELERLVRDFRFEADPIEAKLRAQLEAIVGEGEERTQRIVIQNALRGSVHGVRDAGVRLSEVASGIVTADNFRLDAACRSASGLTRRIAARRERVLADLQRDADEQAAEQYATDIKEARAALAQRAEQRDRALADVVTTMQEIFELDAPFVAVLDAQALLKAARQQADAIDGELQRIERVLALPWPGDSPPDSVEYVAATVEAIAPEQSRLGLALAAFALAAVVSLAVAVVVTANWTGLRRQAKQQSP